MRAAVAIRAFRVRLVEPEQFREARGLEALHGDAVDDGDGGEREAERQELAQRGLVDAHVA